MLRWDSHPNSEVASGHSRWTGRGWQWPLDMTLTLTCFDLSRSSTKIDLECVTLVCFNASSREKYDGGIIIQLGMIFLTLIIFADLFIIIFNIR